MKEGERMEHTFEKRKKVIYDLICDDLYVPMKLKEIAMLLQIPREQRNELKEVLEALEADGKIYVSKKGKYVKGQPQYLKGIFQANLRGFGFVLREDEEDVFIPEENINGAFQGDEVEFLITKSPEGRRKEGKIVRVVSHGMTKVIGLYEKSKSFGFVRPDNQRFLKDIYIPAGKEKGAMTGHKVVVELTSYGGENMKPEGKVVEIIGHINDPGTDIMSIVKGYDMPVEFPEKVLNQAERVGKDVSEADMAGRMDLRDWQMVTIDGEDAKDLDDAVSLTEVENGWKLGVHIADVTNYVQEKSALDREALKRGTSVYLADRVIPMLPHKLSNGICSLNAGENRLALSCIMTVDKKGEIVDHVIAETVIRVDRRMTYTAVNAILTEPEAHPELLEEYHELVPMFRQMQELSALIRSCRKERGAIDFEFPESKVILDAEGTPVEIRPYPSNVATRMIEDFMLMANETVAEEYCTREIPFLYRTHDKPDGDRMEATLTLIREQGIKVEKRSHEITPGEVQKILTSIEGTPEEPLISRLLLRSMARAIYTPECSGHFGLAASYYCHFTSPIRRYPDLQIHRIIKDDLRGRLDKGGRIGKYSSILQHVAEQSSAMEQRAAEAEREAVKLKKAEYMLEHVGEEYDGVISGVTGWGFYVELPNTVEGLVHIMTLKDDYYNFDEENYRLVGEQHGRVFRLGEPVRVRVRNAEPANRTINFTYVEKETETE